MNKPTATTKSSSPEAGDTRHQLLLVLSAERIHQRLVKGRERLPANAAPLRALTPGSAVA